MNHFETLQKITERIFNRNIRKHNSVTLWDFKQSDYIDTPEEEEFFETAHYGCDIKFFEDWKDSIDRYFGEQLEKDFDALMAEQASQKDRRETEWSIKNVRG
jgi:DNA replication initiation complex subunit (GINS family)